MTSTESPETALGLYLHFPFCAHRCHYCDYAVEAAARPPVGDWLKAVDRELELRLGGEGVPPRPALATVYLGGGTPSLLGARGVEQLADVLSRRFRLDAAGVEWTVEANPSSLDRDGVRRWRAAGVNRVSLGVQSFGDRALRWLGRLHDADRARASIAAARAEGLEELSVDLLYGLPEELGRDWDADLRTVRELAIPHVSLYGLTVGEDTPLGEWVRGGSVAAPPEDRTAGQYLEASRALGRAGWDHYQMGSLARPGHRSRHAGRTRSGRTVLAVGPSAHGRLPEMRYRNVARWPEYRTSVQRGTLPEAHRRRPDSAAVRAERIWLRLHTREGLTGDLARWVRDENPELVSRLQHEGWLRSGTGPVEPTPEGWLRLDDMTTALTAGLAGAEEGGPAPSGEGIAAATREN